MFMFSCRFETKMRQNAPNPISISLFSGVTPGPPPLGALPPDPRGGEGRGKGMDGERGGKGEGEVCIIAVGGIDAPELRQRVCLSVWVSVTAGFVSKRLNLS